MAKLDTEAAKAQKNSHRVSPSPNKSKPSSSAVFGSASQFKGIGRGVKGDPRK